MKKSLLSSAVAVLMLCPALAFAQAPASKSAPLATELVKLLESMKLDSVAGSRSANEYVAAMYFPGSQLVVVNAKTTVPDRMKYLILQKSYKDLYVELNGAVDQSSKTFISDLGANGLQFKREKNQPFDTVDAAGKSTPLDGDWRKAKISEQEYTKIYQAHDEAYSQMLQALIATLKSS
ncbi:MAG TPA: hypothetical protein VFO31_21215 [Vicinamibacterales bacterium]|nr:hypothetical protein [Vicinamibacterales bacterium]